MPNPKPYSNTCFMACKKSRGGGIGFRIKPHFHKTSQKNSFEMIQIFCAGANDVKSRLGGKTASSTTSKPVTKPMQPVTKPKLNRLKIRTTSTPKQDIKAAGVFSRLGKKVASS